MGGGPAGAAAAIALARGGLRVALVERRTRQGFKLGESIPPQARTTVDRLLGPSASGEMERRQGRFRTYGNASCWGSDREAVSDFVFTPQGYGLRVDRPRFDRALRRRARDEGAELKLGAAVTSIDRAQTDADWRFELDGTACSARFLVDCTGRSARLAQRCGARRSTLDRLFAFARVYEAAGTDDDCAQGHDTLTRIESGPDGWWYSALLPTPVLGPQTAQRRRLVVFHTDRDLPAARQAATPNGFDELLDQSRHIGPRVRRGGYTSTDRPRGAPAGTERLDRFVGPGWVAAGDAAQAFDPLSSQGIGTALRSGLGAGAAVASSLAGDDDALARYADEQEALHADHLRRHRYFYGCEPRWPGHPFWSRRHGDLPLPPSSPGPALDEKPLEKETSCASRPSVP